MRTGYICLIAAAVASVAAPANVRVRARLSRHNGLRQIAITAGKSRDTLEFTIAGTVVSCDFAE